MNKNEKQMRYQSIAQLNKLKRTGAKDTTIETLRRSMTPERGTEHKGKVYGGPQRRSGLSHVPED